MNYNSFKVSLMICEWMKKMVSNIKISGKYWYLSTIVMGPCINGTYPEGMDGWVDRLGTQ